MGRFAKLDRDPDFDQACTCAHRYVEPFIHRAIARQQSLSAINEPARSIQSIQQSVAKHTRYYFLEELVKAEKDPEKIRGHVMNILVAGRDTTASLLSSLFFTLAQRPDVYSKLQEEVAFLNGRSPTYEDIKEMKYLNCSIKEALRLYSVVPLNTRVANKDTTLPLGGGPDGQSSIYVRQGQTVVYQVYSLHRRIDLWGPDADEFQPERWYKIRPRFEYLPFNAGPRICPGRVFDLWSHLLSFRPPTSKLSSALFSSIIIQFLCETILSTLISVFRPAIRHHRNRIHHRQVLPNVFQNRSSWLPWALDRVSHSDLLCRPRCPYRRDEKVRVKRL